MEMLLPVMHFLNFHIAFNIFNVRCLQFADKTVHDYKAKKAKLPVNKSQGVSH